MVEQTYDIRYHKRTKKHKEYLKAAKLDKTAIAFVELCKTDPFKTPPRWKPLTGDLKGLYSRRINDKHRFVYSVDQDTKTVSVHSMWSHYEY